MIGFILGFLLGGVLFLIVTWFMVGITRVGREHQIYMDGYCAGIIDEQEYTKGNKEKWNMMDV